MQLYVIISRDVSHHIWITFSFHIYYCYYIHIYYLGWVRQLNSWLLATKWISYTMTVHPSWLNPQHNSQNVKIRSYQDCYPCLLFVSMPLIRLESSRPWMSLFWSKSLLKTGENVKKKPCVKHLLHGAQSWEAVMEKCPEHVKLFPLKSSGERCLCQSVLRSGVAEALGDTWMSAALWVLAVWCCTSED